MSARDYHAIDWYRAVKGLCPGRRVFIATDLVEGEGVTRIINYSDEVVELFKLDIFLFKTQSKLANLWRNLVKLIFVPIMAYRLNRLSIKNDPIFHAHSMYYIFLCWFARVPFIATPMGSDVLVRPDTSILYRIFTIISLKSASVITVDSVALADKIRHLCGQSSYVIQNGIDSVATSKFRMGAKKRFRAISLRGMDTNYRIQELLMARNKMRRDVSLEFIYPFQEEYYHKSVMRLYSLDDCDHGRVSKEVMYKLLTEAYAVFSIPVSDSSPRSVYESIFCGAIAVVSYGAWIDLLPPCMRQRVIVVDIEDPNWFEMALELAHGLSRYPFIPSEKALELFDETRAMKMICERFYGEKYNE